MSNQITADLPFPITHTTFPDRVSAEDLRVRQAAADFRAATGFGVLASLGATNLLSVPGEHGRGGLAFIARILPFTTTGARAARPARMGVLISVTPADEIDIRVRHYTTQTEHLHLEGIYIDQLAHALLALDYDGPDTLNPRYWPTA